MLIVDTSGSMNCCTAPGQPCIDSSGFVHECNASLPGYALNSCGMVPSRLNDAKCALRKTVQAFAGEVNFGMATYAHVLSGCGTGTCASGTPAAGNTTDCGNPSGNTCNAENYGCTVTEFPNGDTGCGNSPSCNTVGAELPSPPNLAEGTWDNGANIVVPMLQDAFWLAPPPPASNVPTILEWFDESCANDRELFADGNTPIAGALRGVTEYLRAGWRRWSTSNYCTTTSFTYTTPLDANDRLCRNVNVLVVTDGDETCDGDPVTAASDLYNNGVTIGGKTWPVRVHVINFAGGSTNKTDQIAAAGGTTASILATNEVTLAQALSDIIAGSVQPEECNNGDDNCNGCVDEGYAHYCNTGQTCCAWTTTAQRNTCLSTYTASITSGDPDGDLTKLPCTTPGQAGNSATWLCYNPGDQCDNVDNNCVAGADEGATKCGNPAHCPQTETCNGQDDNCDGSVDNGGVCGTCVPSAEVCDGCDNDCNGIADDGIAAVPCGFSPPANCAGTISCKPPQAVPPGGCVAGGGYNACTAAPQTETCDGIDNDCDGVADDNVAPSQCVPVGTPPGLHYGAPSQCQLGTQPCGSTSCNGFVGPSAEICDGIDNDCDGVVDDSPFGVGLQCGINFPPCTPGVTACVNGALVCQGGTPPLPEVCDGVDNNCNGQTDEAPLSDAPLPGQNGCWQQAGNCCSHGNLHWCPPPGGTCNGVGTLQQPCNAGTMTCGGASGWVCQGGTLPANEVCDGVDNDCDGSVDDGSFPSEGQACGLSTPPCQQGTIQCTGGSLDCVGDIPPSPEVCNGIDDNCDGTIDNGIPIGGACNVAFDTTDYPDTDPDAPLPPCQPGHFQCDGNGGLVCVGGVGPSPEVCDGVDNDCDGDIDETGAAPNGIDGSDNPFPPPDGSIGEACGTNEGACTQGSWACVNGTFTCLNQQGPQVETCDCVDQDCNGVVDNQNPNNDPPLCGTGKSCVEAGGNCQCAAPCSSGEFQCPAGQSCIEVTSSETGRVLGNYCITDTCPSCPTATTTDGDGNLLCAPEGTQVEGCGRVPECVCKGQSGCQAPCFGVVCDNGLVCTNFGPQAGQCVANNCFNVPCQECGKTCNGNGECVTNPCTADSCRPDEVCKPSEDLTTFTCTPSCAGVMCDDGKICKDGTCVATCQPPCGNGEYCDMTQDPPSCETSQCTDQSCPNGGCCDPTDGSCGTCPCEGVICPEGQKCADGECEYSQNEGGGGAGGGSSEGGGGNSGTGASGAHGGNSGDGDGDNGLWGLATGGGGCACDVSGRDDSPIGLGAVGLAMLVLTRRRRERRAGSSEGGRR